MKSWLIDTVGKMGGYHAARLLTWNQPKILMYHRFSEQASPYSVSRQGFEQQLITIKRHFNPMTLSELAGCIKRDGRAPQGAVVITVDDGYSDFYEIAYPLLKKHSVPATFFVTTGFVNGDVWLWPDQVSWLLDQKPENTRPLTVADIEIDLLRDKSVVWQDIINTFLSVSNKDRLRGLSNLEEVCGAQLPVAPPNEVSASTWSDLEEMQRNGIEIGGHTFSHPSLGRMTKEEARAEIERCAKMLTENLGEGPRSFCYPNGSPEDYSDDVKATVAAAGFTAAVTAFSDKYNICLPYAWRRFVGTEEPFQFKKSLFGVEHIGNIVRNTSRCSY